MSENENSAPVQGNPFLVVVTEFPGKTDLVTGRLLSGETGRIFWELVAEAGIDPALVKVLPVINQRPGSGKIDDFCVGKKEADAQAQKLGMPSYPRAFIKSGKYLQPRFLSQVNSLLNQIRALQPNLVLCLGSLATWAVLDSTKFTPIRGTCLESPLIPGQKVLPTYHPVTIMRDWSQKVIAGADLMKAKREMMYPEVVRPSREVWVPETKEDLAECEKLLNAERRLTLDIETKDGQITCVGFGISPRLSICIPITDSRQPSWNYWANPLDELSAWAVIKHICENAKIEKVLQNGVYDIQYLWRVMNIKTLGFRDDTMIMHHCLFAELPKSLGFMGSIYTNEASWKLMRRFEEKELK